MFSKERKVQISWAMYDWANSAFATTVMAAFFPVFFKQFWSGDIDPVVSTAKLGLANSLAGIAMAVMAPLLGAIADRGSAKKKFLFFFAFLGILMTVALYLVGEGEWQWAIAVYVLAILGFSGGNLFYDALLTAVAPHSKADMVSSLGFAFGYLGGGLLFALNVWMTLKPGVFGFLNAAEAVRFSFLTVGIWWAVFSIPLFLFVPEPEAGARVPLGRVVSAGFLQLRRTFQEIRHLKVIFLFLAAYWLYIDGVDTIIRMALDYGMSIGFHFSDLILALLITQFVGFPAALAFGYLGGTVGTKRAILLAIAVYCGVSLWGAFMTKPFEFYILAAVIGLVQGGIQALSRSFYARIIPLDKSAEYFGFYNMIGKFSVVIGPVFVGMTGMLAQYLGYSGQFASRIGITAISVLFIAGGILLFYVDEAEGRREAGYLTGE